MISVFDKGLECQVEKAQVFEFGGQVTKDQEQIRASIPAREWNKPYQFSTHEVLYSCDLSLKSICYYDLSRALFRIQREFKTEQINPKQVRDPQVFLTAR